MKNCGDLNTLTFREHNYQGCDQRSQVGVLSSLPKQVKPEADTTQSRNVSKGEGLLKENHCEKEDNHGTCN